MPLSVQNFVVVRRTMKVTCAYSDMDGSASLQIAVDKMISASPLSFNISTERQNFTLRILLRNISRAHFRITQRIKEQSVGNNLGSLKIRSFEAKRQSG